MSVELWPALTPLCTVWLPEPMFTPGLMFAPALMSVLLMPTLASTPTFGFTFTVAPLPVEPSLPGVALLPGLAVMLLEIEVWQHCVFWFMLADEFTSVDCCEALTLLLTVWSPLPTFTPGLMFAPRLTSVLVMP